jgi:hypothetical protein
VDLEIWTNPGGFGSLVKHPALVLYYSGAAGCVFVHKLQGKVTTAQVDTRTVYQKKYPSIGIPCTAVRVFGLKKLFWKVRSTTLRIIKTYNPYTKILNFVLLIWEERNSERYEHARACHERARAPRAPKKIHQPSTAIPGLSSSLFGVWGAFLCISYRGKLLQHKLIRVQCTKKSTRVPVSHVPQYRYSVYKSCFERSDLQPFE